MAFGLLLALIHLLSIQNIEGNKSNNKHDITIFAITNLDDNFGKAVTGAEWLAIQEINNNTNLFPNYTFNLRVLNCHNDRQQALLYSLNVTAEYNSVYRNDMCYVNIVTKNNTYFPIMFGVNWSSLSATISPVLSTFNMGLFSGCSTSIALSNTNKFEYFYRTIPSDVLQAEGIILLCNTFNWTSIIVVYVDDEYGLYLSLEIQQLSTINNIDSTSIAISESEDLTYNYAAKQIKSLNSFIIIIIIHEINFLNLFDQFKQEGITGYPYLYIGTDGWLDEDFIRQYNLSSITAGFIGTVPWQTNSLSINDYDDDIKDVIAESMTKANNVLNSWSYYYNNGYSRNLYMEIPGAFFIYGYDAMYSIAYAIKAIEENGNNIIDLIHNMDSERIIKMLNDILVNQTDFIGASGRVIFDNVGDRLNGFYSFGNVLSNGSINYFGYLYDDLNGTIQSKLNINKIIWPNYFNEKGIIPQSDILIYNQITEINKLLFDIMLILCSLSILIAAILIIFLIIYHKNKIIRAASWRLNIIMCFGGIFACIAAILYGIDERLEISQYKLNLLCNIRLWLLNISFTVLFLPLFSKTYRLSKMFKNILNNTVISDKQLIFFVLICIFIDILLLILFIFIMPLKRIYINNNLETLDKLQQIQYKYGSCSSSSNNDNTNILQTMYGIVAFWKLCELGFGIYAALNVSRIQDITNTLTKFDETGIQLLSILLTVLIVCISGTMILFANFYTNYYYLLISITILIIVDLVLYLNLLPRILAVIKNNEQKYQKSPAQRLESKIKQELARFSNGNTANLL